MLRSLSSIAMIAVLLGGCSGSEERGSDAGSVDAAGASDDAAGSVDGAALDDVGLGDAAAVGERALFLGNSYTDYNDLGQLYADVVSSVSVLDPRWSRSRLVGTGSRSMRPMRSPMAIRCTLR